MKIKNKENYLSKKIIFYLLSFVLLAVIVVCFLNYMYKKDSQQAIELLRGMLSNNTKYEYRLCNLGNHKNVVVVNNVAPFLVKENKVFLIYTPYHNFEEARKLLPDLPVDTSIDVAELHQGCNLRD